MGQNNFEEYGIEILNISNEIENKAKEKIKIQYATYENDLKPFIDLKLASLKNLINDLNNIEKILFENFKTNYTHSVDYIIQYERFLHSNFSVEEMQNIKNFYVALSRLKELIYLHI